MLQHFKHLYTNNILTQATQRYGFHHTPTQPISGSSHSYAYHCTRSNTPYILKITHTNHRTPNDILAELHFINHLALHGINTPKPIPSLTGNLVETIPTNNPQNGNFIAIAYEKAPGALLDWRHWTPHLFAQWGALIGKMHTLTKHYTPPHPSITRRQWHQDRDWQINSPIYPALQHKAQTTKNWLNQLPTDNTCFGLIHSDLHQWNFFHHNNTIIPFDFDNTHYDWFISDFTTIIINALTCQQHHYHRGEYDHWTSGKPMNAHTFLDYFMTPFMEAYRQHNTLHPIWMHHLPAFLNRHWLTFYTDALWHPTFPSQTPTQQAANFPWRTLQQTHHEVMTNHWNQFNFTKYT